MKVLVIFLVFLVSVIVCESGDEDQSGYGMYEPMPSPMYEPIPSAGTYPVDQSNYLVSATQLLGMATLFTDGWPTSSVTPFGVTNQSIYLAHVCSKSSKISQVIVNSTASAIITCNGLISLIGPRNLSVLIDGKQSFLNISKLYTRRGTLNGNSIEIAAGMIVDPILCKGDIYFRVTIYLANSQYQCVTTGLDGQKAIYSLTIINGNCGSYCWLQAGVIGYSPPINILGAVPPPPATPTPSMGRNSHHLK